MRKINFGCGSNRLNGWENHDMDVDISKPLPFSDASVDRVFAEHVVEHVTPLQAFEFFIECRRIMKPGGIIRIAVPSVTDIVTRGDADYHAWVQSRGWGDGTLAGSVRNILANHGHQAAWNAELLGHFLIAAGFQWLTRCRVGQSDHAELCGIEGHGKVIGDRVNAIETCVVEATA